MTGPLAGETAASAVAAQIAQLSDLFRRRLLEDRGMRQAFEAQQARIEALEAEAAGERLRPLLRSLGLVVDRARSQGDPFGLSLADELVEALAAHGFDVIEDLGVLDPSCHQVVGTEESSTAGVVRVVGVGFRKGERTVVPARVIVGAVPDAG